MAGVFLDEGDVVSSFVAEAMALDQGSEFLTALHSTITQDDILHIL